MIDIVINYIKYRIRKIDNKYKATIVKEVKNKRGRKIKSEEIESIFISSVNLEDIKEYIKLADRNRYDKEVEDAFKEVEIFFST